MTDDITHNLTVVREALEAEGLSVHVKLIDAAIEDVAKLRTQLASARKALEPFAADKMPSLRKSEISRNRDGLRCAMSPMEIACQAARYALTDDLRGKS